MLRAVSEATARLEGAGFETVAISPYPQAAATFEAFQHIFTHRLADLEFAKGYAEWIRTQGRRVTEMELLLARSHAIVLPGVLRKFWQVDAVLSPTLACDPPRRGHFLDRDHQENFDEQTRWSPWGSLFNVAKLPAISVPWPVPNHPPVGVHLGGITLDDASLLGLAQVLHP